VRDATGAGGRAVAPAPVQVVVPDRPPVLALSGDEARRLIAVLERMAAKQAARAAEEAGE
jgi:hypothetical protein